MLSAVHAFHFTETASSTGGPSLAPRSCCGSVSPGGLAGWTDGFGRRGSSLISSEPRSPSTSAVFRSRRMGGEGCGAHTAATRALFSGVEISAASKQMRTKNRFNEKISNYVIVQHELLQDYHHQIFLDFSETSSTTNTNKE